jgi:hypothetical protein
MKYVLHSRSGIAAAATLVLLAAVAGAARADDAVAVAVVNPDPAPSDAAMAQSVVPASLDSGDEKRITSLHARLMITPSQEALWSNVTAVMRTNDHIIDALAKARHDGAPTMTAVEDLRSYGEITEAHALGIRNFTPVFSALYDKMTTEQKTNADKVFRNAGHKQAKKST